MKLAILGVKREKDRIYYIKEGAVWSAKKGKTKPTDDVAIKVAEGNIVMDYKKYIYFLDKDGDIAASERGKKKED